MPSSKEVITNHNEFYVDFPAFEREVVVDEEGTTKTVKLFAFSFVGDGYVDNFILEDSLKESIIEKLAEGLTPARKKKIATGLTARKTTRKA